MPYHHQRCCSVKFYNYERLSLAYVHLNIAKGTTDPRVEFISQDHGSQFTNLEHIISEPRLSINFKIPTKHQYFDYTLTSKS